MLARRGVSFASPFLVKSIFGLFLCPRPMEPQLYAPPSLYERPEANLRSPNFHELLWSRSQPTTPFVAGFPPSWR